MLAGGLVLAGRTGAERRVFATAPNGVSQPAARGDPSDAVLKDVAKNTWPSS